MTFKIRIKKKTCVGAHSGGKARKAPTEPFGVNSRGLHMVGSKEELMQSRQGPWNQERDTSCKVGLLTAGIQMS